VVIPGQQPRYNNRYNNGPIVISPGQPQPTYPYPHNPQGVIIIPQRPYNYTQYPGGQHYGPDGQYGGEYDSLNDYILGAPRKGGYQEGPGYGGRDGYDRPPSYGPGGEYQGEGPYYGPDSRDGYRGEGPSDGPDEYRREGPHYGGPDGKDGYGPRGHDGYRGEGPAYGPGSRDGYGPGPHDGPDGYGRHGEGYGEYHRDGPGSYGDEGYGGYGYGDEEEEEEGYGDKDDYPTFGATMFSPHECVCLPGYGASSSTGPCHKCPVDTWAPGTTHEPCKPCPHGTASPSGSTDAKHCVPYSKVCGTGGYLLGKAKKPSDCGCYPGYGLQKGDAYEAPHCMLCPAGTYSEGEGKLKCKFCPKGTTSPAGSWSEEQCYKSAHFGGYDHKH